MTVYLYLIDDFEETIEMRDGTRFNDASDEILAPQPGVDFVGVLDLSKVDLSDIYRIQNRFYAMGNAFAHDNIERYLSDTKRSA